MATTTLYWLPSSGAAAVSPPYATTWTDTSQSGGRIRMPARVLATGTTPLTDKVLNVTSGATAWILAYQFVSDPIPVIVGGSGDMGGLTALVVRCAESDVGVNAFLAVNFRLVSNDGQTSRGDFVGAGGTTPTVSTADTEFALAPDTRKSSQTGNSLTAQPGDRFVVEVGVSAVSPTATGTATMRFGSSAATDFTYSSGLNTDLNPGFKHDRDTVTIAKILNTGLRPHPFSPGLAR